ncbi:hypothetical protein PTSG_05987 [Salpingoeca rosetta]|uniref:Exostosin GT47 domain-containing protein n=1 Tax=Salpingoeca rosetta (strain ATCC 50818 / BSB-021) TaxID=946362 RepID=F2UDC7_SALR5|nr:uncharacterized protein PTSG_05987 [Salpingoeca rosetta]EGD74622.1 hypothetical protein PTSG_05987 [Salpingoeca rosetta]|eukprot:XP_004992879.1 hypothetical protein PTSG_05987 [Salpingoeca rosetta]
MHGGVRFFVYPLRNTSKLAAINAEILDRNRGWVYNEWNQHNQYIPEHVFHENLLHAAHSPLFTTDPANATHFLLPFYGRIGMYEGDLLPRLQDALLSELASSPWFQRSRGSDHILVWSSQRPLERLLGPTLLRLLRANSRVRFLAVEDDDPRPGVLRFIRGRDIKIPPYVPAAVAALAENVTLQQQQQQQQKQQQQQQQQTYEQGQQEQQQQQQQYSTTWAMSNPRVISRKGQARSAQHSNPNTSSTSSSNTRSSTNSNRMGNGVRAPQTSARARDTFLFFAGTLSNNRVRTVLKKAVEGHPHCVIHDAQVKMMQDKNPRSSHSLLVRQVVRDTLAEMATSEFCLCPRGLTAGTRRIFEAVLVGCIPVIVSDGYTWPFPHLAAELDAASVRVPEKDAARVLDILGHVSRRERVAKRVRLAHLAHNVTYHLPAPQPGDAFYNIIRAIADTQQH